MDNKITPDPYQFLEQCPCGSLALDPSGTIFWVSATLLKLLDAAAEDLVGQPLERLPLKRPIDPTQEAGAVQNLCQPQAWLQWTLGETGDATTLLFFTDITEALELAQENERLSREVQALTITDALTGLANPRAIGHALGSQVTRTRRYHNPLSVVMIALEHQPPLPGPLPDDLVLATSRFLRNRLRWADVVGRWDHDLFIILLPETGEADSSTLMRSIEEGFLHLNLCDGEGNRGYRLRFGITMWRKGDDPRRLLLRAQGNLLRDEPRQQSA
ncbi:MAG: hypothetical protein B0D96_10075 [Candidatus Sedimenticola endophacoides]|uniref:diguanylate cyclase n=1 Tax=Candidatus Sedimenticola endophacoides TaxID=2548426 RepID=A0A657PWT4_9GAMM|nr:MAG: hypothetical protein B0D94_00010 [Candidatus Sedimenticola endophacoides]OQX34155.1 MAG: hypothetical protein B0D96_10075 [Candidatus Sedimenticola endophacoides]OQX42170.1 MAG: hypothetical protein B0D89_01940 [Candidatus Sedimenticola endophacoides]OQX44772.1 MAG: hypothetical protein B0D88_01775 [Candidatus Sedimenticola endophacoides]OQX45528.1 MAG: hypothetical protein B0D85_05510 [Candidatus Sedimenticola endophacoides]